MLYAVVSDEPKPFLLGRYKTLEAAKLARGHRTDLWLIYELTDPSKGDDNCEDFGRCNCLKGYCDKRLNT